MKVFIGYVSLSGNTEKMAVVIKKRLMTAGCKVHMERLDTVEVDTLKEYDLAFIGLYTWNKEELPYEAKEFYEEIEQIHFPGVKVAYFGSGDLNHRNPCAATHILSERMKERGFQVYDSILKVHQEPTSCNQVKKCEEFADHALIWGRKKKKWRFLLLNGTLLFPRYDKSAYL